MSRLISRRAVKYRDIRSIPPGIYSTRACTHANIHHVARDVWRFNRTAGRAEKRKGRFSLNRDGECIPVYTYRRAFEPVYGGDNNGCNGESQRERERESYLRNLRKNSTKRTYNDVSSFPRYRWNMRIVAKANRVRRTRNHCIIAYFLCIFIFKSQFCRAIFISRYMSQKTNFMYSWHLFIYFFLNLSFAIICTILYVNSDTIFYLLYTRCLQNMGFYDKFEETIKWKKLLRIYVYRYFTIM